MNEPNSQPEKPKGERRYDPELLKKVLRCDLDQYDMLKRCSDKKDMAEWNEWRKQNPNEDILLEGANLVLAHLKGAQLWQAYLEDAKLQKANLQDANLNGAHLEGAKLHRAILRNAEFWKAHLEDAVLLEADLRGAYLTKAKLLGTDFSRAIVDGITLIWRCEINRNKTKFEGVGLDAARIYPELKQLLEYNIRRMNWEEWYPKQNCLLRCIVHAFWWVSDYGISTPRIIKVFFALAGAFAVVYYLWGLIAPLGIVDYLFVDANGVKVGSIFALLRALHFSVVIMTVGFTNMHANAHSFWAHILVGLQMILGFVLLGALVTRFAVLFTAGGPAGKFADEKEKEDEKR